MPESAPIPLALRPRLESWNATDHPDQLALAAFVAHVKERIDNVAERTSGPLTFRLHVGLPEDADPLWQRDLDNYLFPIARGLPDRVVSVWATKGRGPESYVYIEPARPQPEPAWPKIDVRPSAGSDQRWKLAVREAASGEHELPEGPVGLEVLLSCSAQRRWTNLWKPTLDGLEPLLGKTFEAKDWNPQDGRIVRLGFHRRIVVSLGHDAVAQIWTTVADPSWPELRWLTEMSADERAQFFHEHRERRPRASGGPPASATRRRALPPGLSYIETLAQFDETKAANTPVLKTDSAGPPKLHLHPRACSAVDQRAFHTKVIVGNSRNGSYVRVHEVDAAEQRWPQLTRCGLCSVTPEN